MCIRDSSYEVLVALRRLQARAASRGAETNTRVERDRKTVRDWFRRRIDLGGRTMAREVARLENDLRKLTRSMPTTLVMAERAKPRETRMFERGDFRRKGEVVTPGVPSVLPQMGKDLPRNRLGLARWLVGPSNPLTARVQVNRVWQQFFGVGIVETPGDFGIRGAVPVHRDLLDLSPIHI